MFVYTLWLKRTSTQNIVIGGAAGAVPVLVGWAAVRNDVAWAPIVLFVVMFLWTPPHFWALAIRYADDYRAANVPMLPGRRPAEVTVRQDGRLHGRDGGVHARADPGRRPRPDLRRHGRRARCALPVEHGRSRPQPEPAAIDARVRLLSITYVTLLFGAMTIDVLVRSGV